MKHFLLAAIFVVLPCADFAASSTPEYSIQAIRYASAEDDVADLVMGAPREKMDLAMVVWLIRGGGRNILFDSGYHRDTFLKEFPSTEYIRPDEAVKLAGVQPADITDIVISHGHWDHMGGIDLFPKATVWIQKEEFRYYTGDAWQPGGDHGGIDPEDAQELVKLNTGGRLRLVDGDNVQLFPGIRAYTGGRHTYASQYLSYLRPCLRQFVPLSQSRRTQSQRHFLRRRPRGQHPQPGAHGSPCGLSRSRRAGPRRPSISEIPHTGTRCKN